MELQPILPAALVVIAGAGLVMLAARRRGRVSTALVMVALVAGSMTVDAAPALGPLESWITVEPDESRSDVRPLYEPPVSPVNDLEFIGASVALYVLMMWLVWFALRVVNASRRSPTERVHAVAAESS